MNPTAAQTAETQRDLLERLYRRYHRRAYLGSDPLRVVHGYAGAADREIAGLVAASLAYGNVKAICAGVAGVLDVMGEGPFRWLRDHTPRQVRARFRGWRYRVTSGEDLAGLLVGVRAQVADHGSLGAAFVQGFDGDLLEAMTRWSSDLAHRAGRPLNHLLASPARGSACKRLCLYLRWMVRRDAIDPGGWTGVSPSALIAPVDVHLHRVARRLGWTRRKQLTLNTALDVTAALRALRPDDPLRYDFALTRPGILKEAFEV